MLAILAHMIYHCRHSANKNMKQIEVNVTGMSLSVVSTIWIVEHTP